MRIALVTSDGFPDPRWRDEHTPHVARELSHHGATADVVTWDGGRRVEWAGYDAVVLQSPWSMWTRLPQFDEWLWSRELDGTRLLNPIDAVALGSNKRYLLHLAAAGTPIVPTTLVEGEADPEVLRTLFPPSDGRRPTVVAKPIAGGGTLGAREFRLDQLGGLAEHVRRLGVAVVQPYVPAIDTHRELGVLMLDGSISHAVTKAAILRPGEADRAHPDPRPYPGFTAQQERVIRQTYGELRRLLAGEPLSVRLDFIVDPASPSGLLLLEAEMVAPVKFFPLFPEQCGNYAEAILARAAA